MIHMSLRLLPRVNMPSGPAYNLYRGKIGRGSPRPRRNFAAHRAVDHAQLTEWVPAVTREMPWLALKIRRPLYGKRE